MAGASSILRTDSLGAWNLYFAGVFALSAFDYIDLNVLGNALLLLWLLLPLSRWTPTRILKWIVTPVAAIALFYAQTRLPGPESFLGNLKAIAGFSPLYIAQLAWEFVNVEMAGWALAAVFTYFLLRNWIRFSFFTVMWFAVSVLSPYVQSLMPQQGTVTTVAADDSGTGFMKAGKPDKEKLDRWLNAFYENESDRKAGIPSGISAKDTPFDILLLNICSLGNDDIRAEELDKDPIFDRFNLRFDRFNAATSYSGPATMRLLASACGQPSHNALYGQRRPECELMNRLNLLGFRQYLFMDHSGAYDNYLTALRDKTGLQAPLAKTSKLPVRFMGFNDEPIIDTLPLMRNWLQTVTRSGTKRTVTLMNLITLHDGNRKPGQGRPEPFKSRLKLLIEQLNTVMNDIEKSGRKVMLVFVPEHGAAIRGDRMQPAKLRDTPARRITDVPVLVKFFGIKGLPEKPMHVTNDTSYLALASLIGRVLETDYFSSPNGSVALESLVSNVPETSPVSENANAVIVDIKGAQYWRTNDGNWRVYDSRP